MSPRIVSLSEVMDRPRLSAFQYIVFFMCWTTLLVEGFDTQAMAYVAPALSRAWSLSRGELYPAIVAGLVGLMSGSMLIAPLADRFGRRRVILWSAVAFGGATLLTPLASSLYELVAFRLVTGVGLGGAMANVVALSAEYSPKQKRTTIVMIAFTGFACGSALSGFITARLIAREGWESVFIFGGILSLSLLALLIWKLPESIRFLALRKPNDARIGKIVSRVDRAFDGTAQVSYQIDDEEGGQFTVRDLFRGGRGVVTLLLWVVYFMNLLNLYLLASWLPTTISAQGISLETAVIATSLMHVAGILGGLAFGLLVLRFGVRRVMPVAYGLSAVFIGAIAFTGSSVTLTILVVSCAGFTVIGCQNSNNGIASNLYPTSIRATGIGWANAVGRAGSIAGPTIAGVMLAMNSDVRNIFLFGMIPALCAAMAITVIAFKLVGPSRAMADSRTGP